MTVKQFKMITGDEIMCEIIEWATDDIPELVVRNAMVIVAVDNSLSGTRYYTFKPWMTMQEGNECLIAINGGDIIAQANPTKDLLKYYYKAVENANLTEDELNEKVEDYVNKIKSILTDMGDSDQDQNVISFPGNSRLH